MFLTDTISDKQVIRAGMQSKRKIKKERRINFFYKVKELYLDLKKEKLPNLLIVVFIMVLIGGALVFLAEVKKNHSMFSDFFDAFWWAVVTITTVGYGDKYPITATGRILALFLMLMGVVTTSILSGTIASIFVDRKIREGKGLQDVSMRNHLVLCGWNKNAEQILDGIGKISGRSKQEIVLINEMDPEEFQSLTSKFQDIDLRFVRGDYTHEVILKKSSIVNAKAAILLSDESGENSLDNADERTILASLAIKSMNPDIILSAEIVNPENEQHLKRANVDDIIIYGEFNGFLLASSTMSNGIPLLVKELLSFESRNVLKNIPIPAQFIGRSFIELADHFLKNGEGILIGVLSEEKKMTLDDILSDDSSAIDAFIKRKFAEAEIDLYESAEKEELQIKLNPGKDYTIRDNDSAFILG